MRYEIPGYESAGVATRIKVYSSGDWIEIYSLSPSAVIKSMFTPRDVIKRLLIPSAVIQSKLTDTEYTQTQSCNKWYTHTQR